MKRSERTEYIIQLLNNAFVYEVGDPLIFLENYFNIFAVLVT
jgi:hypothetical protein